ELKTQETQGRQRITDENDRIEQDVKQKLQHASWLAESVLEATQIQLEEEGRKKRTAAKQEYEALDALEKKSLQLLDTYNEMPAPDAAYEADEFPPEKAAETLKTSREAAERYFAELGALRAPKLFVGVTPYLVVLLLIIASGVIAQMIYGPPIPEGGGIGQIEPQLKPIGIAVGGVPAL